VTTPAPERFETGRLLLRRPSAADAAAIFHRYSSDPIVTKYLGWPRHTSVDATRAFLAFSEEEWQKWPAGPYLIESLDDGRLLGGTGFGFETPAIATTGYVLATDAWGHGYATEALTAVVTIACKLSLDRLYALCHPDNLASVRVLEKCGFVLEERLMAFDGFCNLGSSEPQVCLRYGKAIGIDVARPSSSLIDQ
jgi:[ribosomal protein S5]-alanine N-acetyltransferase